MRQNETILTAWSKRSIKPATKYQSHWIMTDSSVRKKIRHYHVFVLLHSRGGVLGCRAAYLDRQSPSSRRKPLCPSSRYRDQPTKPHKVTHPKSITWIPSAIKTLPWLGWLFAGLPLLWLGSDPRPGHVRFMVDEVAVSRFFCEHFSTPPCRYCSTDAPYTFTHVPTLNNRSTSQHTRSRKPQYHYAQHQHLPHYKLSVIKRILQLQIKLNTTMASTDFTTSLLYLKMRRIIRIPNKYGYKYCVM